MTKQTMKFGVGALALVLLGLAALYIIRSYIPEYQARKAYEKLIEEYKNDPYGGETPEETLSLFIDALKKGDVELAAKYFVIDKQGKWYEDLVKIEEKGLLGEMIQELENAKRGKDLSPNLVIFSLGNEKNESTGIISVILSQNKKWKIKEL